ncbi:MAG: metallopeptidase family protein [Planctomycetes bacterium]|nr:metallopeptidase family protein [Planctomycetota bacterium]
MSDELTRADELLRDAERAERLGDDRTAADRARRALAALRGHVGESADAVRIDALAILVAVATNLGEWDEAARRLAELRAIDPSAPEADFLESALRLERWDLDGAAALLVGCDADAVGAGELEFRRAIVAELRGEFDVADVHYAAATRFDPTIPTPVRIDLDEAHALLTAIVDSFPPDVRDALGGIQIDLLEIPEPAVDRSTDLGPTVLGYYDGVPLNERESIQPLGLDRIRIFKRNIEREVTSRDELVEQLRITLLHEVGHHLGWDEHELHERGIG